MGNLNWDALGLRPSKPQPRLYNVSLSEFQAAIDRLSWELRLVGICPVEARLIPEWEYWMFYDERGNILVRVRHEDVERVALVLKKRHDADLDAQIDALMKEPKREW